MRLSMEEVQKMKNWFTNYVSELSELGKKVRDIFSIEEAQNLFDTIEALQQENEQLRAQVARMRDVLDELTSELDYAHLLENGIEWDKNTSPAFDAALDLLNSIKYGDYHNPADVEALRKAREALVECIDALELCTHNELCKIAVSPYDMIRDAKEALAEIDKAIGGETERGKEG